MCGVQLSLWLCHRRLLWPGAIASAVTKGGDILRQLLQACIDHTVHGAFGRCVSSWHTSEQCQTLVDMRDGIDVETSLLDRFDHIVA